ncbi:peroxidase 60 [Andrographis paniculata]|uniref:peroxidase 60 n=1 Tax=Andrographis paniculata TaxID=175694 RepID=UPI0021E8920E|nr:peroxidase 60 [Andrographis paniculata]
MLSSSSSMIIRTLIVLALAMTFAGQCRGDARDLQVGFYKNKCLLADVEAIVGNVVADWKKNNDSAIAAALLRMQFHDCFVDGCDASILLDGENSEKKAGPNLSVRGYELIDAAKAKVEEICPGVVSCADIIVMATRDAVALSGGEKYSVQTGRRDGTTSLAKNVNLPGPTISVSDCLKLFSKNKIDATTAIYLLGGHTVGIAHCSFFMDRLYNFSSTGKPDPNMDPILLTQLRARCPQKATFDNTANLDQDSTSFNTVDESYYNQIVAKRGVLPIDQNLALDPLSKSTVETIASSSDFGKKFGEAMVKLGAVGVLTGKEGQIRRRCRSVNLLPF